MNGFGRYMVKIACVFAAVAVSFVLTLYFSGATGTYSKFISRAGIDNNAFTVGTWVIPEYNIGVIFRIGSLSVFETGSETVNAALMDGLLFADIMLPDNCDPSDVDLNKVQLEFDGRQTEALSVEIGEGGLTASFDWNEVAAWIENSGQSIIDATVTGTSRDGSFTFRGAGPIQWNTAEPMSGALQEIIETTESMETTETTNSTDAPETTNSTDAPETTNSTDAPETTNITDTVSSEATSS